MKALPGSAILPAGALLFASHLAAAAVPTFTKDVAPILYKNCATCHRAAKSPRCH